LNRSRSNSPIDRSGNGIENGIENGSRWEEWVSESGREYYYNTIDGTSSWDKPVGEAYMAAHVVEQNQYAESSRGDYGGYAESNRGEYGGYAESNRGAPDATNGDAFSLIHSAEGRGLSDEERGHGRDHSRRQDAAGESRDHSRDHSSSAHSSSAHTVEEEVKAIIVEQEQQEQEQEQQEQEQEQQQEEEEEQASDLASSYHAEGGARTPGARTPGARTPVRSPRVQQYEGTEKGHTPSTPSTPGPPEGEPLSLNKSKKSAVKASAVKAIPMQRKDSPKDSPVQLMIKRLEQNSHDSDQVKIVGG
jgi:hypothetical protein